MQATRQTVRYRASDLTDITPPDVVLFTPFPAFMFVAVLAIVKTRNVSGTISTPPEFKLTNGTDDILAADENADAIEGNVSIYHLDAATPCTHDKPLTLTKTVAAAGTTPVMTIDLVVEGYILHE